MRGREDWHTIRRKQFRRELIFICILVFLLLYGIVCDWIKFHYPDFASDNLRLVDISADIGLKTSDDFMADVFWV